MKKIITRENCFGERVDKFLVGELFSYTRGEIIRNIKEGRIVVNGKKIKPSYVLKKKDEIEISIPKVSGEIKPDKNIRIDVIYQDENIIIINKPAGLAVHPSPKKKTGTLVEGLLYEFPEIKSIGDAPDIRPGIVHRLDKDTSGVMAVARNQKAYEELKRKFKNREVGKTYLAVVSGDFENQEKSGTIEKPLARASNYKKQVTAGKKTKTKARPAVTKYKVIKEFGGYSLLEARPKTGRMHQIRVHFASMGHPVLGDKLYGKAERERKLDICYPKRQLLHSKELEFELFGRRYFFRADLPEDFSGLLD